MGLPFALSIHHFVNSVGADAGFLSIIGLAILIFLFFAQMRETATLREEAEASAERVRQLESRLTQVIRAQAAAVQAAQRSAQQPAQPGQPARPPVAPGRFAGRQPGGAPGTVPLGGAAPAAASADAPQQTAVASLPRIAPAGVAAPALSAATKLIPTADDVGGGGVAIAPPPPAPAPIPVPAPFDFDDTPAPVTAAAANGGGSRGTGPPPRMQLRGTNAGPPPARRPPGQLRPSAFDPEDEPSSLGRTLALGGAFIVVIVIIVIVLLSVTGGGGGTHKAANTPTTNFKTSTTHKHKKTKAGQITVDPSTVTVAVLNGTAQSGLAGDVSDRLSAKSFKQGEVTNATAQTHTTTIVYYIGAGAKDDALAVAKTLGLASSSVQAIDPATQSVACTTNPARPCPPTKVVVTVGSDLSGDATGASGATGGASTAPTSTQPATSTNTSTTIG